MTDSMTFADRLKQLGFEQGLNSRIESLLERDILIRRGTGCLAIRGVSRWKSSLGFFFDRIDANLLNLVRAAFARAGRSTTTEYLFLKNLCMILLFHFEKEEASLLDVAKKKQLSGADLYLLLGVYAKFQAVNSQKDMMREVVDIENARASDLPADEGIIVEAGKNALVA